MAAAEPQTLGLTETHSHFGWAAGAGAEVALTQHWSAKVEYLFVNLSDERYALTGLDHDFRTEPAAVRVQLPILDSQSRPRGRKVATFLPCCSYQKGRAESSARPFDGIGGPVSIIQPLLPDRQVDCGFFAQEFDQRMAFTVIVNI